MNFYKDLQKVASDVLNTFNQGDIKLVKFEDVISYDEDGSVIEPTPDNPAEKQEVFYQLKGSVSGVSWKYISSGFATQSDLELTVAVLADKTISIDDYVQIDGVSYKIIEDVSTPSAGVPVVWKFVIRKGG